MKFTTLTGEEFGYQNQGQNYQLPGLPGKGTKKVVLRNVDTGEKLIKSWAGDGTSFTREMTGEFKLRVSDLNITEINTRGKTYTAKFTFLRADGGYAVNIRTVEI